MQRAANASIANAVSLCALIKSNSRRSVKIIGSKTKGADAEAASQ